MDAFAFPWVVAFPVAISSVHALPLQARPSTRSSSSFPADSLYSIENNFEMAARLTDRSSELFDLLNMRNDEYE